MFFGVVFFFFGCCFPKISSLPFPASFHPLTNLAFKPFFRGRGPQPFSHVPPPHSFPFFVNPFFPVVTPQNQAFSKSLHPSPRVSAILRKLCTKPIPIFFFKAFFWPPPLNVFPPIIENSWADPLAPCGLPPKWPPSVTALKPFPVNQNSRQVRRSRPPQDHQLSPLTQRPLRASKESVLSQIPPRLTCVFFQLFFFCFFFWYVYCLGGFLVFPFFFDTFLWLVFNRQPLISGPKFFPRSTLFLGFHAWLCCTLDVFHRVFFFDPHSFVKIPLNMFFFFSLAPLAYPPPIF